MRFDSTRAFLSLCLCLSQTSSFSLLDFDLLSPLLFLFFKFYLVFNFAIQVDYTKPFFLPFSIAIIIYIFSKLAGFFCLMQWIGLGFFSLYLSPKQPVFCYSIFISLTFLFFLKFIWFVILQYRPNFFFFAFFRVIFIYIFQIWLDWFCLMQWICRIGFLVGFLSSIYIL